MPRAGSDYQCLAFEDNGGVTIITLNRPNELNALNQQLKGELIRYFEGLAKDRETRVVMLIGAGRAFCAGLDLKERTPHADANAGMYSQQGFSDMIKAMRRCPQPIVACVKGPAAGGGLGIALASDIRIAGESARFNAAFIKLGLSGCDIGVSYHLPRLIGASNAAEMIYTGRFYDAERALRTGLVSHVVPDDQLAAEGLALAQEMAAMAPMGLRMSKECFWANVDAPSLDAALAMEDRNQILTVANGDPAEGMKAFVEKRKPNWAG